MARKSVDLTTLAGWEALSSGTHNITIVAKANGFKDSAPSAAVQVEKASEDALSGTWVFNDVITLDSAQSFNLVFISGGIQGTSISIEELFGAFSLYYTWENSNVTQAFTGGQWTDTTYKTINITSKLSEVTNGEQLLTWLQKNATKQEAAAMPVKGDIITLDSKQYRVLKINGTIAEVLCMYDANSSIKFDTNSNYNNTYAGKNIDTYCNNTFYSGLSAAMKSAIVDKTFTQDSWTRTSSEPSLLHYTGKYGSKTYYLTLDNAAFGTSITRHCYCLSVQDVLDYLEATTSMGISNTTLTDTNIWKLFWNVTTSQSKKMIWLRSAYSSNSKYALYVYGTDGRLLDGATDGARVARPAFQIDLSKIAWSK